MDGMGKGEVYQYQNLAAALTLALTDRRHSFDLLVKKRAAQLNDRVISNPPVACSNHAGTIAQKYTSIAGADQPP
jgi:hypothetical protein